MNAFVRSRVVPGKHALYYQITAGVSAVHTAVTMLAHPHIHIATLHAHQRQTPNSLTNQKERLTQVIKYMACLLYLSIIVIADLTLLVRSRYWTRSDNLELGAVPQVLRDVNISVMRYIVIRGKYNIQHDRDIFGRLRQV